MNTPPVWLFDSMCILCDGAVRYTLKHENAPLIRFVAIQSDEGRQLAVKHDIDPDDPGTFLFVENGHALTKSDGVLALVRHLNGPARMIALGRFIPKPLRDAAYDLIARNRYRLLGRSDRCILPDDHVWQRFTL